MAGLRLNNIWKKYGDVEAVKDFNLEIEDKEFIVFVGPSGCGKSTTLRMIAGLEEISAGELFIDDRKVNDVSAKDRDIAMVFQNYALYPHMSVYENMSFGLKLRKFSKAEIDKRVKEAAGILGIEELLQRKPKQLSGGQRQRVALGRAIVREPKVFLMDEPLSNLDAKLRVQMRAEILKLHERLQTTFVYVTHDQTEAMTMASRIVIMKDGVIQQIGCPQEVYDRPENMFVAGFIGSPAMNFIKGKIVDHRDGLFFIAEGIELPLPEGKAKKIKEMGNVNKEVYLGIRPEDIHDELIFLESSDLQIDAKIEVTELTGFEKFLHILVGKSSLIARVDARSQAKINDVLKLFLDPNKIHFFSAEDEKSLL